MCLAPSKPKIAPVAPVAAPQAAPEQQDASVSAARQDETTRRRRAISNTNLTGGLDLGTANTAGAGLRTTLGY